MSIINIIEFKAKDEFRHRYRYALYERKLTFDGTMVYSRHFIVLKNQYDVIVHFSTFHKYVVIHGNSVYCPLTSNARAKLLYVCDMLNYVFVDNYEITKGHCNESDTPYFEELLEKSIENGVKIDEILGDTAYSSAKNIEIAEKKNIKTISKLHPNTNATKTSTEFVHFNKDANTFECVCGHLANRNKPTKDGRINFNFSARNCKNCTHKKNV